MPATTYSYEVKNASLASLLTLKERWRVSVKAQTRRLSDLDLIPEDHATSLYRLYSAKGWNREEPLDRNWPISEPAILANALQLIVDSAVRRLAQRWIHDESRRYRKPRSSAPPAGFRRPAS